MKEKIFELINNVYWSLDEFHNGLTNIIWENQEGQEEHFDKLCKAEQIAIYSLYAATKLLLDAIESYKSWFK